MVSEHTQSSPEFIFCDKLDDESIKKYTSSNLDFCSKIFKVFLSTIPKTLDSLDAAVSAKDFPRIRTCAHNLKSNFKIVGLENIALQISDLEKLSIEQSKHAFNNYLTVKPELEEAMSILYSESERLSKYLSTIK